MILKRQANGWGVRQAFIYRHVRRHTGHEEEQLASAVLERHVSQNVWPHESSKGKNTWSRQIGQFSFLWGEAADWRRLVGGLTLTGPERWSAS
jgi:hypothetical protein